MKIDLPYGKTTQTLEIPDGCDTEILRRAAPLGTVRLSEDGIVLNALQHPIGSPRLGELAKGKKNAVILCSDHTRPVPSRKIIPHLLAELRRAEPDIAITLLVATGFHRLTTRQELLAKFGEQIVRDEMIAVHDSRNEDMLTRIGTLPSGAELIINKTAAGADLLLSEGFIEPHFFAGFSGGRKSVLPGICSEKTVFGNHCSAFIADPHARTGNLDANPIHRDMEAAARLTHLAFIANVLLNDRKQIIDAVAGDPFLAHAEGCRRLKKSCTVRAGRPAGIVVTTNGGAPLDQNIYQTVKCLTAAEAAAGDGAVLIACSECADGIGGDGFYRALKECRSAGDLLKNVLTVPQSGTKPDQWQYQILARVMERHRVILVCCPAAQAAAREMKFETAGTVQQAFDRALAEQPAAKVTVIPDGVSVIVR